MAKVPPVANCSPRFLLVEISRTSKRDATISVSSEEPPSTTIISLATLVSAVRQRHKLLASFSVITTMLRLCLKLVDGKLLDKSIAYSGVVWDVKYNT